MAWDVDFSLHTFTPALGLPEVWGPRLGQLCSYVYLAQHGLISVTRFLDCQQNEEKEELVASVQINSAFGAHVPQEKWLLF